MRLAEQRKQAKQRNRRIKAYAEKHPDKTLDELGIIFGVSRETARKALK